MPGFVMALLSSCSSTLERIQVLGARGRERLVSPVVRRGLVLGAPHGGGQ